MPGWSVREWWRPTAVVVGCLGGALLLTAELGADRPRQAPGAAPSPTGDLSVRAPGALASLLPQPDDLGYGRDGDDLRAVPLPG